MTNSTEKTQPKNNGTKIDIDCIPMTGDQSGIIAKALNGLFHSVDDGAFAREDDFAGVFNVTSVIRDRRAGSVEMLKIYDAEPNVEWLSKTLTDEGVREEVARTLLSRPFSPIFSDLIVTPTVKLDQGGKFLKADVLRAVKKHVKASEAANVLSEMLIPTLIKLGLVNAGNRFTARVVHGYDLPTIKSIETDIIRQELEHLLNDARAKVALTDGRVYAVRVVGDEFNEAFFHVGKALRQIGDYSSVLKDLVKGVRASIDPNQVGLTGAISRDFVNRTEVSILSTNYNFIQAALELNKTEKTIKPSNEEWKLDKWVPVVFALIRNSDRYAMVGREEFCSGYDLRTVSDLRGFRRVAMLTEAAKIDPVGQTVIGEHDIDVPEAWNLAEPRDKVGARLVASYHNLPEKLSTLHMAESMGEMLRNVIETGLDTTSYGVICTTLAVNDAEHVAAAYAALTASGVRFTFSDEQTCKLVYKVPTEDKTYHPRAGFRDLSTVYTASPWEALLVSAAAPAKVVLGTRPQLIAPFALNSRLLGLDDTELLNFNGKASFSFTIMDITMRGRFEFSDLLSFNTGKYMRVVRPWFNTTVAATSLGMLRQMRELAKLAAAAEPTLGGRLTRDVAKTTIDVAQSVAVGFRKEIHDAMRARTVAGLAPAEAVQMSAKLRQDAFTTIADCYALDVFMRRMGLTEDQNSSVYSELVNEPEFVNVLSEYPSDRKE